jgi:hypothetical protein
MKRNDAGTATAAAREAEQKPPVWSPKVFANGATLEDAIFGRKIDGRNGAFVRAKRSRRPSDVREVTSPRERHPGTGSTDARPCR